MADSHQVTAGPEDLFPRLRGPTNRAFADPRALEITNMFREGAVWVGDGWTTIKEAALFDLPGNTTTSQDPAPADYSSYSAENLDAYVASGYDSDPLGPLGWHGT
jgi:membrane carboxypeptidase/penicillin-binding protein